MPIWLRRFTVKNLQEHYSRKNEEDDIVTKKIDKKTPNYNYKAPKK